MAIFTVWLTSPLSAACRLISLNSVKFAPLADDADDGTGRNLKLRLSIIRSPKALGDVLELSNTAPRRSATGMKIRWSRCASGSRHAQLFKAPDAPLLWLGGLCGSGAPIPALFFMVFGTRVFGGFPVQSVCASWRS
jgi:hypothetical protein